MCVRVSNASDWADVAATSVGSLGTAAAFFVTYLLLRRETARDEQTSSERRKADDERRRLQATLVTCWYEQKYEQKAVITLSQGRNGPEHGAMVLNSSSLPIYDVHVRWARKRTRYRNVEERWRNVMLCMVFFDVLPPADTPVFVKLIDHKDVAITNLDQGLSLIAVQMSFRDSAGRQWLRRVDGTLEEVDVSVDPADAVAAEPQGWEILAMTDYRQTPLWLY